MGTFLLLNALLWLAAGLVGLGTDAELAMNHSLLGYSVPHAVEPSLGPLLVSSALLHLIWLLIGIKLLVTPYGRTLGCTGMIWLLVAVACLAVLTSGTELLPGGAMFLGAVVAVSGLLGGASVVLAQW